MQMMVSAMIKLGNSNAAAAAVHANETPACIVCGAPSAAFVSTDRAPPECPPAPVCGTACERRYIEGSGCQVVGQERGAGEAMPKRKRQKRQSNARASDQPGGPSKKRSRRAKKAVQQRHRASGQQGWMEHQLPVPAETAAGNAVEWDHELGIAAGAAPL